MSTRTVYLLRNRSYTDGSYRIGEEYSILRPGETVKSLVAPTSVTANITYSCYIETYTATKTAVKQETKQIDMKEKD